MIILVTGGAGYIGSHICVELLNSGYEVIVADNFMNSKPDVIGRIEQISNKTCKIYQVDLLDKLSFRRIFHQNNIDAVIHLAGLKSVGESTSLPLKYYHNNVTGTLALCETMNDFGIKKIVFSSSATVYGMKHKSPLTEDLPLSTTNPYGTTKLMIEQILRDLFLSDSAWSIAILRYFNPIGAHESGLIGENPNHKPNNLMPSITQVAVGNLKHLTIYGCDYNTHDGTGVRDYIHVVDLAKGHIKALEKVLCKNGVEVFNLGTGTGYSVFEIIRAFERVTGIPIPYVISDQRPGDVAACYADTNKANTELGWKAEKTIDDMCKDSWRWQSTNPNGY